MSSAINTTVIRGSLVCVVDPSSSPVICFCTAGGCPSGGRVASARIASARGCQISTGSADCRRCDSYRFFVFDLDNQFINVSDCGDNVSRFEEVVACGVEAVHCSVDNGLEQFLKLVVV